MTVLFLPPEGAITLYHVCNISLQDRNLTCRKPEAGGWGRDDCLMLALEAHFEFCFYMCCIASRKSKIRFNCCHILNESRVLLMPLL